jgi:hypothetical protein
MEDELAPILSSESFVKFSDNDRCRISRGRVQDFLDRGLMSQGDTVSTRSAGLILTRRRCSVHKIYKGVVRKTRQPQEG